MDLIEDIGPILGIVAFLGFAVLALLIVLQAREVRRLREWAGRAPERSAEAEAAAAAAQGTERADQGDAGPARAERTGPSRLRAARDRAAGWIAPKWDAVDRNSPVHPLWLGALLIAAVVALGVVTSGFGLAGGDEDDGATADSGEVERPSRVRVAVLNATQMEGISDPVPGVASQVADEVIQPAGGFRTTTEADALVGEQDSIILFEPEAQADAERLAGVVEDALGPTEVTPMTTAARDQTGGEPLVLLVGFDDAGIADTSADATP